MNYLRQGLCFVLLIAFVTSAVEAMAMREHAVLPILGNPLNVWVNHGQIANHPGAGFVAKALTVSNDDTGKSGCYIACYSHKGAASASDSAHSAFVQGLVRVSGQYNGRNCAPKNVSSDDLAHASELAALCQQRIASCGQSGCWAGGDTGSLFGL